MTKRSWSHRKLFKHQSGRLKSGNSSTRSGRWYCRYLNRQSFSSTAGLQGHEPMQPFMTEHRAARDRWLRCDQPPAPISIPHSARISR